MTTVKPPSAKKGAPIEKTPFAKPDGNPEGLKEPRPLKLVPESPSDPKDGRTPGSRKPPGPAPVEASWIRIETAAALLDMSPSAFRKLIQRNQIPDRLIRRFGRAVRINKSGLLKWIDRKDQ